jgi:tetratricopeptide (TPR) repeat protein
VEGVRPLPREVREVVGSQARGLWLGALERADKGTREEAHAAVDAALQATRDGTRAQVVAARLLLLIGEFGGALRAIAAAEARASTLDDQALVLTARALAAGMLGDFAAAMTAFEDLAAGDMPLPVVLAAVDLSVLVGAADTALHWAQRATAHPERKPGDLVRIADLLNRAGADEAACATIRRALADDQLDPTHRSRAAQLLLSCRACDEASEVFQRQVAERASCVTAHLGLATIHLWRGETGDADHHAQAALAAGADAAAIRRLRAGVRLLEGQPWMALEQLDCLVAQRSADAETRVWRAEALLRAGQVKAAIREVRVAGDASPDNSTYVALRIIAGLAALHRRRRPYADLVARRAVAALCGADQGARVHRFTRRFTRRRFIGRWLVIDRVLAIASRLLRSTGIAVPEVDHPKAMESIFESALQRLGGNRTHETPTRVDDGKLLPLRIAPPPRAEVKAALYAVRIGGYDEARKRLDLLTERYPDWPHPWFYRAELLMWMGLLDDARRDLDVALRKNAPSTRHGWSLRFRDAEIERSQWPLIGLAGIEVLQGRPKEALRTITRATRLFNGPPAQPYFAWRGEILRALGRYEEARTVLEQVCPPGGYRLGSWITLALTCRDLGDRERPRQILAYLAEHAPRLMLEVTGHAVNASNMGGALAEAGALARLSDDETHELLERARQAMRGNRSASCVTFVDASNRLHAIPPGGVYQIVNRQEELTVLRAFIQRL